MTKQRFIQFLLLLTFATGLLQAQSLDEATRLIGEARKSGQVYAKSKDKKAAKSAKKALQRAEKSLKKLVKKDRNCELCWERLSEARFLLSYYGFEKNYKDCLKTVRDGRRVLPNNPYLALIEGVAYNNSGRHEDAIRTLNAYLALGDENRAREKNAREVLAKAQDRFLNSWYNQDDFFNSKESRVQQFNPRTFRQEIVFQITPQTEQQLAGQAFREISQNISRYNDPEVQGYLNDLVSRIVSKTPGPQMDYEVIVVDSAEVNALTVPGKIFVNTGLIGFARNEAELSAVLSHELAHNYGHHSARRMVKEFQAKFLTKNLLNALNLQGQTSRLVANLASEIGLDLALRAYDRFEEKEADLYGAHLTFNAGYDPTSLSSFLLQMYERHPKQPVKFLSRHPPTPDRVEYVTDYLEYFPIERELRLDSQEFQRVRSKFVKAPPPSVDPVNTPEAESPSTERESIQTETQPTNTQAEPAGSAVKPASARPENPKSFTGRSVPQTPQRREDYRAPEDSVDSPPTDHRRIVIGVICRFDYEEAGALVLDVLRNSPAEKTGIRAGDVILEIEKTPIQDCRRLVRILNDLEPKDMVEVFLRRDKHLLRLPLVVNAP